MPGRQAAPAGGAGSAEALTTSSASSLLRFFIPAAALSAGLTWVAFRAVVPGFFLGDDFGGIALVRDLGVSDLPALFRMYEGQGHYRPVWGLFFWALHQAFGLGAPAYHACALLLHALCGFALACLVARVAGARGAGLAAAALFLVHPIHGPILGWIASMHDPLSTLFVLLALIAHDRWTEGGKGHFLALTVLAFGVALLVKEVAVATLPCALVLALVRPGGKARRILVSTATLGVITAAYLALRMVTRSLEPGVGGWLDRVPRLVAGGLAELVAAPGAGALGLVAALVVAVASVAGLLPRKRNQRLRAAAAFALVWILLLVPQAPAFAVFTSLNTRLLYAPATAAAAAVALLGSVVVPARVRLPVGLAAVATACALELMALLPRLEPFVRAGQLSARYRDEMHRVVPELPRPSLERPLVFFTNRIPLPAGIANEDLRYFWPLFDRVNLAVAFGLPLPEPLFRRGDLGPGVLLRWIDAVPILTQIGGMPERAAFVAWLRGEAARTGAVPDSHFVLLFWDERTETLERVGAAEVVKR